MYSVGVCQPLLPRDWAANMSPSDPVKHPLDVLHSNPHKRCSAMKKSEPSHTHFSHSRRHKLLCTTTAIPLRGVRSDGQQRGSDDHSLTGARQISCQTWRDILRISALFVFEQDDEPPLIRLPSRNDV